MPLGGWIGCEQLGGEPQAPARRETCDERVVVRLVDYQEAEALAQPVGRDDGVGDASEDDLLVRLRGRKWVKAESDPRGGRRVNPLESWRQCYATSALTWTADAARARAISRSNGIGASPSLALCLRVVL